MIKTETTKFPRTNVRNPWSWKVGIFMAAIGSWTSGLDIGMGKPLMSVAGFLAAATAAIGVIMARNAIRWETRHGMPNEKVEP